MAVSAEEPVAPPGKGDEAMLGAVYPNPAVARVGGAVTVPLALAEPAEVRVAVYDVLGREVAVLAEGVLAAGRHTLALAAGGLVPGVYVVRAVGPTGSATRRITVLR